MIQNLNSSTTVSAANGWGQVIAPNHDCDIINVYLIDYRSSLKGNAILMQIPVDLFLLETPSELHDTILTSNLMSMVAAMSVISCQLNESQKDSLMLGMMVYLKGTEAGKSLLEELNSFTHQGNEPSHHILVNVHDWMSSCYAFAHYFISDSVVETQESVRERSGKLIGMCRSVYPNLFAHQTMEM